MRARYFVLSLVLLGCGSNPDQTANDTDDMPAGGSGSTSSGSGGSTTGSGGAIGSGERRAPDPGAL